MLSIYKKTLFALVTLFLIQPVLTEALGHDPGVQVGYWVKYGNIVGVGPFYTDFNETDYIKVEVVRVAGSQVNLRMSRTFKNGTLQPGVEMEFHFDTGITDAGTNWYSHFIIPAGLVENDEVKGPSGASSMIINKTETRYVLGANRTVDIANYTASIANYVDYQFLAIYDQTTGFLLQFNESYISQSTPAGNEILSFEAVEMNTIPSASDMTPIYVASAVVLAAVAAGLLVLRRKRKIHGKPKNTVR